jgi:LPS export ABC transporter protein LptC
MVQEISRRRARVIWLRARMPIVARYLAIVIMVIGILYAAISYYRLRHNTPFRMIHKNPELSTQVEGITHGYERRIMKDEKLWILLKANKDILYSDMHHELEEVYLEIYPEKSEKPDKISAERAITNSIIDDADVKISFVGNVNIETHDSLIVKTEAASFDKAQGIAETSSNLTFIRENISGSGVGAKVDSKNKRLELFNNVEIIVEPKSKADNKGSNLRSQPVTVHAARAIYDQTASRLEFTGKATVEQNRDMMSGEAINLLLNKEKHAKQVEVRGNSYLRTLTEGHAAEINSVDMDIYFDKDQKLEHAVANRDVRARTLEADADINVVTSGNAKVQFQRNKDQSLLRELYTDGRPVVTMSAPKSRANDPQAANKRLTSDNVKLLWRVNGKDIEHTEAVGNAELIVDPVQPAETKDRKIVVASRFDCDFYETGNIAKLCKATEKAKATFEPTIPTESRGIRTLVGDKITSYFMNETQDVEKVEAQGDVKFNERDRNGQAASAVYTTADGIIKLRGGNPHVWDSRARIKAIEIDTDNNNGISYARERVATTYYNQEQTNGAAPFTKVKSPVYITSDRAEFYHETGLAIYTGGARAWQDDNYVKGDKIILRRETKVMEAHGHVQTAIYHAKRKAPNGTTSIVPVFATADHMTYSDIDRLVHYESNVDIKQGVDRTLSYTTDVYLLKDSYEVEKSISQKNVVITQPGRRGTGDWSQYTAADETVVLKGEPAYVEDTKDGNAEGRRITVYLRDNRVIADDEGGPHATGRVRSTHRIGK